MQAISVIYMWTIQVSTISLEDWSVWQSESEGVDPVPCDRHGDRSRNEGDAVVLSKKRTI